MHAPLLDVSHGRRPARAPGRLALAAVALLAILPGRPAHAQPADVAAAQVLFDEGRDLATRGDYAQACMKFEASLRLEPALGTRLNLADCYEASGKLASAWAMFKAAADVAQIQRDKREALAAARAAKLEPRLPRLVVRTEGTPTPGMTIVRSGSAIEPAMLGSATFVDPGRLVITASAPGFKPQAVTVDAKAGETAEVVIRALEPEHAPLPQPPNRPQTTTTLEPKRSPPSKTPPVDGPAASARTRHRAGLVIGGGGIAVLGAGLLVGVSARGRWNDAFDSGACSKVDLTCTPAGQDQTESARHRAFASTVMVGVGAAALGVGVYLYLTGGGSSKSAETPSRSAWVPVVGQGGAGVAWTTGF